MSLRVRPLADADRSWAEALITGAWGGPTMVTAGRLHDLRLVPGLVAELDGAPAGLATYEVDGDECEVLSLNSVRPGAGAGRALLGAVAAVARSAGCRRAWLVTTNDNTAALRFYQRAGWDLAAFRRGAVVEARREKPSIPELGIDGIPIRHELELELRLDAAGD